MLIFKLILEPILSSYNKGDLEFLYLIWKIYLVKEFIL